MPNGLVRLTRVLALASLGLVTVTSAARSQAKILSDPGFLLWDTRDWSRASPLGDLRERSSSKDYRELRVWAGYGKFGTDGIVIRHEHGTWKAWFAVVVRCTLMIPSSIQEDRSDADSTALASVSRVLRAVSKLVQRKDELLRGLPAVHNRQQ